MTVRPHQLLLASMASIALGSLPLAALAQPNSASGEATTGSATADDRARAFREGREALNTGHFAEAHRIYSELWEQNQSPDVAANLGVAELELRQYPEAARHLSYALENLLPSTLPEQKRALEQALASALQHVAVAEVEVTPADAAVEVDGARAELVGQRLFLAPGEHTLSVSRAGYQPLQQSLTVAAGETRRHQLSLQAEPESTPAAGAFQGTLAPPPEVPRDSGTRTAVRVTGIALTGLAIGAGVVFTLRADSADDDADSLRSDLRNEFGPDACTGAMPTAGCSDLQDLVDDGDRDRTISVVSFVAAGVFGAATVASFVLWPEEAAHAGVRIVPVASPKHAGLGVYGRF